MRRLVLAALALPLAGCAAEKPPAIAYDAPVAAHLEIEPAQPVPLVAVPKPLPLPGQLKPMRAVDRHPPAARIAAANTAARTEPERDGFLDAIQVWPYHPGALYQLHTAMGHVSDLALEPGETLSGDPAGGDTERWEVGSADSGTGDKKQVHLLIKPKRPGLSTNMVIVTDRRTYHLELLSAPQPQSAAYLAAVSWDYPLDLAWKLDRRSADARSDAVIDDRIALQHLHHRYRITGDAVPWRPVDVWDDERKVYIQMPAGLAQGEAPPLFIIGPQGDGQLVNYRLRGGWYIVDRLFAAAELRLGADPQQTVRISRTDGIARTDGSVFPFGTN